ncbi:ATP-binding protein [Streptomonospora wellingtoniae]|uniref:LuxR C-terminal-related transcriptional regulator n=1 Tax=Streptomonospora wellingtoniae TaxID=3075544 RepID=A0ABU2KQP0_9ACTN|nr:LuxR C-terminal-related transcriptional regulator [Streptomonospora sp. DSM 45055]MDT0301492.1 LuxR C-terminal-related transcriptional regulator [Streptomonospora sp. DSM 45055]
MATQTAPARQNLPVESDSLIGRDRDLSELLRLLETDRVLTLTGASGIGKTRLALRLAAQATASFRDGVWLAALADVSTRAEVAARLCGALGVMEEGRRDPLETVGDALRGRSLLLVFDGIDGVADHVAEIAGALATSCPSVSLLVTGREPLRVGRETVWRVPPLPVRAPADGAEPAADCAVRLFLERARAAVPDYASSPAELAAVNRICRRVDGVPLAVELAAAWAGRVDAAGIDAGLAAALEGAGAGADRNGAPRSLVLDAVVGWSHSLLSMPERVLLRRLSVFPNWCLELAESVCAEEPLLAENDVLDLLSALLDRSLITLTGEHLNRVRYRLPAPVREHARERLAEAGEDERIRARHTSRMLAVAEDLGRIAQSSRAMPWRERFAYWDRAASEYDNIRAALHWSVRNGRVRDGLRLCAGMRPLWFTSCQFAEGEEWYAAFLSAAEADPDGPAAGAEPEDGGPAVGALRGRVLVYLAELAWPRKRFDETAAMARAGADLCRAAEDWTTACLAENLLALIAGVRGDAGAARRHVAGVLELARSTGDLWNEAFALNLQGSMAARDGSFAEADTRFNTSLMIMRGMDHRWGVGSTLMAHGAAAEAHGDVQTADRCYREAMDIHRTIGAAAELAACLAGVGRVARRLGSVTQACDYLGESLHLCHTTGQRGGLAETLASIAGVADQQGMREEAARCAGAASALLESSGWSGFGSPRFPLAVDVTGIDCGGELRSSWEEGRRLGVEDAVDLAAGIADSGRLPRPRPAPAPLSAPPKKALTRREREIARLVGEECSNRTISERLVIAPATVARHLANINRKMGFNSRTQIAQWVTRHSGRTDRG